MSEQHQLAQHRHPGHMGTDIIGPGIYALTVSMFIFCGILFGMICCSDPFLTPNLQDPGTLTWPVTLT